MGRGLALRWALMHEVWLGSRQLEKADAVAREYDSIARGFHEDRMKGTTRGALRFHDLWTWLFLRFHPDTPSKWSHRSRLT